MCAHFCIFGNLGVCFSQHCPQRSRDTELVGGGGGLPSPPLCASLDSAAWVLRLVVRPISAPLSALVFFFEVCAQALPPLCDIPSGRCSFTGPWTVTRSSLRMLRQVATFCRPLRPVLLLVSFPRSRSPVVSPAVAPSPEL